MVLMEGNAAPRPTDMAVIPINTQITNSIIEPFMFRSILPASWHRLVELSGKIKLFYVITRSINAYAHRDATCGDAENK